ncbi:MAG: RNA methyltransferase [Acutalibacteraceae bacterium]|nr:RNA methyltransferase [Acutalibacteraceae bacterium]
MQRITSKDNSTVKHIAKLMKSSSYRKEYNQFVIEGVRLCIDALESDMPITTVVFSESALKKYKSQSDKLVEVCESTFVFSDKLFSQISDTKSPQGILCVCNGNLKQLNINSNGVFLALEHIQDPSNMGTILRTAEALGVNGVILTDNCCDVFSPKVLRGTMGAVFRLPMMICNNMADTVNMLNNNGITTIAMVVGRNSVPITSISSENKKSCTVLIGNEGNGLEQATIDICKIKATIPMLGRAESLNASVAASISMWEVLRGK